jgi:hypothetical protein
MLNPARELYSIHDAGKDLINSGKDFLSIELSLDGFSYCVLDTDRFRYVMLESFSLGNISDYAQLAIVLEDFVRNRKILTSTYQRISILFVNPLVTLVPSELFAYSEKNEYLDFNVNRDDTYEVRVDKLYNLSAYAVYPFPRVLLQKINYLFPGCRIRHMSTSLIENLTYLVRYGKVNPQLVLHVQANHFEILIYDQEKLSFFNSFRYQTRDDLFYYLFFVLEQLGLQAEDLDAMLFGEVSIKTEFYKKIKLYVKSLSFGPRNDLYKYSDAFDEVPHHYFYNLLNLNACG